MNLENMTAAQRRAIESDAAEILCVAGPGSGKTTVLTKRIVRILESGIHPSAIVAITYTNAAARNLEDRLALKEFLKPLGTENESDNWMPGHLGFCGTLHGFCLRMLKRHGQAFGYGERTAIIDEDASRELIEAQAKTLGCKTPIDKLLELKAQGRPVTGAGGLSTPQLVILAYMEELVESGLLDFDLILTEFNRLLVLQPAMRAAIEAEFSYFFVDEVQDCALIDWKIFRALPIANKFLVGDPDQAIFGFRGGDQSLMMTHRMGHATMIVLEENFRCREEICAAANQLIEHNTGRLFKKTVSGVGAGGRVVAFGQTLNEGDEIAQVTGYINAAKIDPKTVAILARTNAIAAQFREALKAMALPVAEAPKSTLPEDWPLARAIIEMMAQPANDTLAFFYIIAKAVHKGASPIEARRIAHDIRRNALAKGHRINQGWAGAPPTLLDVPRALDQDHVSHEARMVIGEMIKRLSVNNTPAGAAILDLALEMVRAGAAPAEEKPSDGITVTTIHSAKGREWDVVFIVGFEDEVTPGSAKSNDVEEERRLAFVAITRARQAVYISHAANRRATWGPKPIQPHKPSRFLKELLP